MLTINIAGPQGFGKTTKAKEIAAVFGDAFHVPHAPGPFQLAGYDGQPAIICDECAIPSALVSGLTLIVNRKGQTPQEYPLPEVLIVTKNSA